MSEENIYKKAEKAYKDAKKKYFYHLHTWQIANNLWITLQLPANFEAQEKLWNEKEAIWDELKAAEKIFMQTPKEVDQSTNQV